MVLAMLNKYSIEDLMNTIMSESWLINIALHSLIIINIEGKMEIEVY